MPITLRAGNAGPDVTRLQNLLNEALEPSPELVPDGRFGDQTRLAVVRFQKENELTADGVVGPNTWDALEEEADDDDSDTDEEDAPWMVIAQRELDSNVAALPGPEANPRIIQYFGATSLHTLSDETPWCSAFVNWCLRQAGIHGTNNALAASWLNWGIPSDDYFGAITVLHNAAAANTSLTSTGNHVGFLLDASGGYYKLLGGNQSHRVKISSFPKTKWVLRGYRWPSHTADGSQSEQMTD